MNLNFIETAQVENGTELKIHGDYKIGDLIKFKYYKEKNPDGERISYSKIKKIIPKIEATNNTFIVRMCYLTENEKFISESMIIEVEKKAESASLLSPTPIRDYQAKSITEVGKRLNEQELF